MKLRKIVAGILAFALVITASPVENVTFASTEVIVNEFEAVNNVLMSATVGTKTESSANVVYCANQGYRTSYQPGIATLKYDILKNIDTWYSTWNWFAYRIDVEAEGTYEIGVKLQGIKNTKYVMPVCVDNEIYTTAFTDTAKKELTVNVPFSKGSHLIVFFMPMPENSSSDIYNAYPWTNVDSLLLEEGISVMDISEGSGNEITEAEVKASLYTRVEAGNETYVTFDHMASGGYSPSNNKSQAQGVSRGKITQTLSELVGDNGELNYLNKTGLPYVQYIVDVPEDGEYYINVGYQFNGTFTDGMDATAFAVIANDKVYTVEQKASGSSAWLNQTLAVELKAGRNVIRTTGLIKDTAWWNASAWMNHDYFAIESGVDFVKQSTTSKNAGDETVILRNNYEDKGDTLGDAGTSNIRTDKPTIEQLPYSGDRISRWPFASVKVEAEKDGYYDITFNIELDAGTAKSSQIGILVNGAAYSAPFKLASTSTIDASVYLKKGTNVITFMIPMPEDSSGITGTNNADYPWANMKTIVFGTGITEFSIPTLKEIRSHLYSTLHSGDETQVFISKFKTDNGNSLADPNVDYMRGLAVGSRVSIETLVEHMWNKGFDKIPYVAYEVTVDKEDDYEVIATIQTASGAKLTSPQLAVVVDRENLYKAELVNNGKVQKVSTSESVHLTKGTHTIMITTPMPLTDEEAQALTPGSEDNWASMKAAYPWCNVYELYIGKGVELGNIIMTKGADLEAENTEYVAGGTVQTLPGTSANRVVESIVNASAELEDSLKTDAEGNLLKMDWGQMSYLEFATTGNAGNHEVSLDVIANCASENKGDAKPKVCIYVNGTIYEKTLSAWNTIETITIDADLVQGTNVFKCFAVADEVKDGTRVFFDTIEYADTLTAVKTTDVTATETTINVGDETTVFTHKFTNKGDYIASPEAGDMQWRKYYIDALNINQLTYVPYAALKVSAEHAGYYDISVLAGPNTSAQSDSIAVLVDGKAYAFSYKKTTETTLCGTVYLEKGKHMLIFTSPMPVDKTTADATAEFDKSAYPWFDMKKITLDAGLSIVEKPGYDDIDFSQVIDSVETIIDAGDETLVLENKYTDKGTTLESASTNDLKSNRVSLETLLEKGFDKAPYASFNVTAQKSGTYELYAVVATDATLTSEQVAVIVDRMTVLDATVEKTADQQMICVEVQLTKGTHNIIFTSPMPLTDKEAQAIPDGDSDGWAGMNGAYRWMNYIRFGIDKDLTVVGGIDDDSSIGLEAEDSTYVKYYGDYHAQVYPNASEGSAVSGKDTVGDIGELDKDAVCYDWNKFTCIEFGVDAKTAGAQKITFNVMATNAATSFKTATPKLMVYVNGEWTEASLTKGWNTFEEVTVSVNLKKGTNIIKCFAMTDTEVTGARVVFDYIEYDTSVLTAVKTADFTTGSTTYNAGDETVILSNHYTDNGDTLGSASCGDMQWRKLYVDALNASQLTYVPYAAMKVSAEADGFYEIDMTAGANTNAASKHIALMVDGKAYALSFPSKSSVTLSASVYLTKGTHILVFTSPMPVDSQTAEATEKFDKSAYPWFDMKTITLGKGLKITEKATTTEVELSEASKLEGTSVNAGDEAIVLPNRYTDNGDTLGGANTDELKSKRVSVETLLVKGFDKTPFASFNVTAKKAGTYDIYALVETDAKLTSKQIAVIVDTTTVMSAPIEAVAGTQIVHVEVKLSKGTHNILFTSPMPFTDKEAQVIPDGADDNWAGMNGAYRWMNITSFVVDEDLTVEKGIKDSKTKGQEAADSKNIKYAGGYKEVVFPGASSGTAVGGDDVINLSNQLPEDVTCYNWGQMSYIEFAVKAKSAGTQKISVRVIATAANTSGDLPKVVIYVNGKLYEQELNEGWNEFEEITIPVEVAKGENVIRVFTVAEEKTEGSRVLFDYIEYDETEISPVTVEKVQESQTIINAGDEKKVLFNHYTDNGDTLGNASLGDLQWDKLSLDVLTYDNLSRIPYAAIKVTAEKTGYYDVALGVSGYNRNTESTQIGLYVDGTTVYELGFEKVANPEIHASVYLTKGTHTLVFTTPMPADKKTAAKTEKFDKLAYPWMDMSTITLGKGLKVAKRPTTEEIEAPFYDRIEAENGDYVLYNNYESTPEANSAASSGYVIGGQMRWVFEQTYEDMKVWLDAPHNSYVEYAVTAPADGEYKIRVGFLAGTKDESVKKPFIAVFANNEVQKAKFTKNWGEIDIVELTINLKKGLNVIRCTSITTEQECFDASTWINHDFLEIEKRLTAEKRTSVKVEAEDSNYINKIKVQDGSENEKASGNKVLGSMDRNYVSSLKMTLDSFTTEQLKMVPYFSFTVAAPRDGYYSVSVNMAGDGRLKRSTIGLLVDGQKNAMYYSRNGQSTESTRADVLVYLKKGEHILTFTAPMPVDKNVEANYSYYWMNYDYVTLHDGLVLADKQKAPTDIADYVRVEAEEYAMLNLNRNTGSVIGGAYYKVAQSLADILQNGIDGKSTAYAEFNIQASEAGTYTLYLLASHGMTNAATVDEITESIVVEHNGDMQTKKLECIKGSTRYTYIPITLKLEKGKNTIRITHATADSLSGDGLAWVDYNYFEMSADVAQKLKFVPISNILEAEDSLFTGYAVEQNESYSQKQYVGSADYGYVDENDVTFENLVPDALEDMPAVTYTFEAEKAGTYTVSIGFAAGMYKYTTEEMAEGATGGIAVIVNDKEKQLVEFDLTSSSAYITRLVTVDLEEGENTITVTTTLADYFHGHTPRIEDEYRLIWVDHDYLLLSDGLSTGKELDKYGLEDSDYNFAQIVLKAFTGDDVNDGDTEGFGWLPIVIGMIAVVGVAGCIVVFLGKKKKSKVEEK